MATISEINLSNCIVASSRSLNFNKSNLFNKSEIISWANFHLYGLEIIQNIMQGKDASDSVYFPRVTMCDFKVRDVAQVHTYTVQCVLPINLFNEKVFIFCFSFICPEFLRDFFGVKLHINVIFFKWLI